MDPAAAAWRHALEPLDVWFATARDRHPGVIPCQPGCTACCHGPFDISVADAVLLRAGLETLPEDRRAAIATRARTLLERVREVAPTWGSPWDIRDLGDEAFDLVAQALADEPCPLLNQAGECALHAFRPLVCRLMGLPMAVGEEQVLENACPIQHRFPAYAALEPQPFDLAALEEAEADLLPRAAERLFGDLEKAGYETFVAAALAG